MVPIVKLQKPRHRWKKLGVWKLDRQLAVVM
ncbi:hypothetical protein P609_04520 [Comamonas thiooxydans]|nr:hypothetical protein P609_04520 [Comamonas thiooxydans]